MKITIDQNELWRGVNTVLDVVPSRPALPVLSNILLTADRDQLTLAATDLDLSISTNVSAKVERSGSTVVPARTFAEIAREWPEAQLSIESESERLVISGTLGSSDDGTGSYSLSGMPPDEFPKMDTSLEGLSIDVDNLPQLDSRVLGEMVNKTIFAVSKDKTRPVCTGVLWCIEENGMNMVATDGSRLAYCHRNLDLKSQMDGRQATEVIVPPKSLGHLVKLFNGHDQSRLVRCTFGASQVLFDLGDTYLLSRLIEGPYVNYRQVIPGQNSKKLQVANDHLLPAVRRVSILSNSYTRQVRLHLKGNSIELTASSQEIGGEAREVIPAIYDEEEIEVGYNATYLMEILRKMGSQEVIFDLSNSVTAAILRPEHQEEGEDYFCLLMPLRPSG